LVTPGSSDADARFCEIVNDAARRILRGDDSPYDVGMHLMSDLVPVLQSADFAGTAYAMWGFLTDGIDGPAPYTRGLSEDEIENLMRLAAREWLDLDPRPDELRRYFARWEHWPDSLREPQD
jgi:hypothetical protein